MEAATWRELASFYNPHLHNLAGPYSRAYGMDMASYVSLVGLWLSVEGELNTVPEVLLDSALRHAHDLLWAPSFSLAGTKIPADTVPLLRALREPVLEVTTIPGPEGAMLKAWISETLMIGTYVDRRPRDPTTQFWPVTMHWKDPGLDPAHGAAWMRVEHARGLSTDLSERGLKLTYTPGMRLIFRFRASELSAHRFSLTQWDLPGLMAAIQTDGTTLSVQHLGSEAQVKIDGGSYVTLAIQ
jgi:hypothetical protein